MHTSLLDHASRPFAIVVVRVRIIGADPVFQSHSIVDGSHRKARVEVLHQYGRSQCREYCLHRVSADEPILRSNARAEVSTDLRHFAIRRSSETAGAERCKEEGRKRAGATLRSGAETKNDDETATELPHPFTASVPHISKPKTLAPLEQCIRGPNTFNSLITHLVRFTLMSVDTNPSLINVGRLGQHRRIE